MTVNELIGLGEIEALCLPDADRQICGAYVGDLLSWVMGRANVDNAWITIMSNVNIVAVATLADVSCILLAEGVVPDEDVLSVAKAKGVNVLSSKLPAFELALMLSGKV